jgi:hypothetical protein
MRSRGHRLLLLLALAFWLLPVQALASASYFCRMMDRAVSSCCCAGKARLHERKAPSLGAEVRASSCCERLQHTVPNLPSLRGAAVEVPAASVLALVPAGLCTTRAPVTGLNAVVVQARAPPPAPGLFLRNCVLLT